MVRKVRQRLDPPAPWCRPSVSLDNFSRRLQEREAISILGRAGAWWLWEVVGEKHHVHRGGTVQGLATPESLGAREDQLEHSVLEYQGVLGCSLVFGGDAAFLSLPGGRSFMRGGR